MAKDVVVKTVAEFLDTVLKREFRLGLEGTPVMPWYLGQPDDTSSILPGFYKSGLDAALERELLRDFRQQTAEFTPTKGMLDEDLMLLAHSSTVPSRIIDWTSSPLVALFLAVESMNEAKAGRVWVFNPWAFNDGTYKLAYVPMTDTDYFKRYVVALNKPEASLAPEHELPMAFRPFRLNRPANAQGLCYTVHGSAKEPIDALKLFGRRRDSYLTFLLIDPARKKPIMRELFNLGITRFALAPGAPSLARMLAYRYSNDYLNAVP